MQLSASPTFIDVFAGAGGLSLGLLLSDWNGLLAIEHETNAFKTLASNLVHSSPPEGGRYQWPEWAPVQPFDIREFLTEFRQELYGLRGKVDLLAGGPPCQGFSFAGRRKANDPRNALFTQYLDLVDLLEPPLLLMENVPAITIEFGRQERRAWNPNRVGRPPLAHSERIARALRKRGYGVTESIVSATDFGVPQSRSRYFLLGIRNRSALEAAEFIAMLQAAGRALRQQLDLPTDRSLSVKEAISDLEVEGSSLVPCVDDRKRFMQIAYRRASTAYQLAMRRGMSDEWPNSLRLAQHTESVEERFREVLRSCRKGVRLTPDDRARVGMRGKHSLYPMHPERPAPCLTSLPDDVLHYSEPRILTVREYARLQSFPDWFDFHGTYTTGAERRAKVVPRYTQVANAVPPLMAQVCGAVLRRLLHNAEAPPLAIAQA